MIMSAAGINLCFGRREAIKPQLQKRESILGVLVFIVCAFLLSTTALRSRSASIKAAPRARSSTARTNSAPTSQFGDPYSDFRDAEYSNDGLLSESDEIRLGAQIHKEVTKKYKLSDVGLERVDRLGQRVARVSLRPKLVYTFHVIEGREINGFSIPGGHVYITTGLLKLANDNELASVLAHEVGHVVARHSLKTLKQRQQTTDIAEALGSITGIAGDAARELSTTLVQILGEGFLTIHTREEEREADYLGVRAMPRAGFDAQAMITMFQKVQRVDDSGLLGSLFSDHPDVQERIYNTRYEIDRMRREAARKG
jgi:beta-barrel assembly-enhancing protease